MTAHALLLLALAALPVLAAPVATHDGDRWRLENNALRVEVNAPAGRFQVLDKASGYLWQGPDPGQESLTTLAIPAAKQPPALSGDLAGWAGQGEVIPLTPDMLAEGAKPAGSADSSAKVRVLWDPSGLFIAAEVSDNKLVFPAPDKAQWWEKDSVEFWLNDTQYAIRFGPWGANVWSSAGAVADAKAAFKQTPTGYLVEAQMPARLIADAVKKGIGGQIRFAFGLNDCDGPEGRKSQLYYPTGWAHSNPTTFALATLVAADGKPLSAKPAPKAALEPLPGADASVLHFKASAKAGGRDLPVTLTLALDGDSPDLLLTIEPQDPTASVGTFTVLHPLVLDRPGEIIAAPYMDGIGVATDDMTWAGREWNTCGSLDMPWVGLTDGGIGYMLLWELPTSCDNGAARLEKLSVGGKPLLAPGAYHYAIKGKFAAPRTIRYTFVAGGGHVAICKRYREYARKNGFLITQKEKMKRKPQLARLAGAPDVWGRSDLKFCKEAKAAGIDRLMVNGAQPAKDMEEIKALGFLMSTYDNYEDAFEGDTGAYGEFKTDRDSVVLWNNELMKAWNTKGDHPKQFMKRCTALFEQVARKWIPLDLQKNPYNARFLDVTTACGLIECFSPTHGLNRTEDRAARRRLASYVGNDLNLVLGGEHGRWWGADIYNYWEGMQSGNIYFSWPAGYVGEDIPQTRDKIGPKYLDWGLGEKHRYPLWELVFHDCVTSTWYWGDSTGHLRHAAPELGYKQDAFNILYGTIPLYWVAQDYSYRWDNPETRERLLESYRNTCKLHEQIGFEEMLSHEFVTPDREVQKTVFGDGTQVWVNFGEQPWTLEREGKQYTLPQYGFYAKGPKIELYRIAKQWSAQDYKGLDEQAGRIGGATGALNKQVTCIKTGDYLYVQGDVPGLVEAFLGAGVTVRREGPAQMRIIPEPTKWVRVNWRAICPEAGEGDWRMVELDDQGQPVRVAGVVSAKNDMLLLPPGAPLQPMVLLGPKALAEMSELVLTRSDWQRPEAPKQSDTLQSRFKVSNVGGKEARDVVVALYFAKVAPENRLSEQTVTVPANGSVEVTFETPSGRYDGRTYLYARADDRDAIKEICRTDNVATVSFLVKPDYATWDTSRDVTVDMGKVSRWLPVVQMPFDPDSERAKQGKPGPADPGSIRVVRLDVDDWSKARCPTQMALDTAGNPVLVWQLTDTFAAGATVKCRIYLDGKKQVPHIASEPGGWHPEEQAYHVGRYRIEFKEGYIRKIKLQYPFLDLMGNLGASSQATGWVDEIGEVQSFQVVSDGPVLTQVRVKKNLQGGHSYDKLYTLYQWGGFTVTTLSEDRFGILSRAYYLADCDFQDDRGNKARIDGKGDAENISGKNPGAKWFATWGKDWGVSCVAVTPADNICYWDAGNKAGLGFTHALKSPATVAYCVHNQCDEKDLKSPDFAALDYERWHEPVIVR